MFGGGGIGAEFCFQRGENGAEAAWGGGIKAKHRWREESGIEG